jgi:hypothetical protein
MTTAPPTTAPVGKPPTAVTTGTAPIVVLTHAHSGAARLATLLAGHPDVACTSGSGILPLCEQAALAWRHVDGQTDSQLSGLALASTRSLVTTIVISLLAREGKRRWCEIVTAPPSTAETFLQLFPGTKVLCLHRALPQFVRACLDASPWGPSGAAFAPFTTAYPSSITAALTAYWTAHTRPLLTFEQAHPQATRRLRGEDLASGLDPGVLGFLGLDQFVPSLLDGPEPARIASHAEAGPPFPLEQIPAPLLEQAARTMEDLGYPAIAAVPALQTRIRQP